MKMNFKVLAFIIVTAVSVGAPASAGLYMSADRLLSLCKSDSVAEQNVCVGYILGIADAAQTLDSEINIRRFCLPVNLTSKRLEQAALAQLNDNLQKREKAASYYVLLSLREAFPCED